MRQKVFTIRDAKAEHFNNPYFSPTHGEAERNFKTAVNDPKTMINKYPEDFDLYYIGEYDTQTGKFHTKETPEHVIKAIDVLNKEH